MVLIIGAGTGSRGIMKRRGGRRAVRTAQTVMAPGLLLAAAVFLGLQQPAPTSDHPGDLPVSLERIQRALEVHARLLEITQMHALDGAELAMHLGLRHRLLQDENLFPRANQFETLPDLEFLLRFVFAQPIVRSTIPRGKKRNPHPPPVGRFPITDRLTMGGISQSVPPDSIKRYGTREPDLFPMNGRGVQLES